MPAIEYRIYPKDLHRHYFEVELLIKNPNPDGQRVQLPSWIPGSYLIRDFSKHIASIQAYTVNDRRQEVKLALKKINNSTWELPPKIGSVTMRMSVYAFDTSVRTAYLDQYRGFYNHSSLCLQVLGQSHQPCQIEIIQTSQTSEWEVATTLKKRDVNRQGFGTYVAANYDELIDQPVALGSFTRLTWKSHGIPHEMAIQGSISELDIKQLTEDLQAICNTHIAFFDPRKKRAPFEKYLFLVNTVGQGYGGLEHRSSTALLCNRGDLPLKNIYGKTNESAYQNFLGLCSHEYFHAWMVKKIQPKAFQPYGLDRKNFTNLLWLFEGFTSYYDDLQLFRSHRITQEQYLKRILDTWNSVLRTPGRFKQSVADSSFDAWTKYYQIDENTPNAVVSYYAKGALIALGLDLIIRDWTGNKKSLDDVIRNLWKKHGALGNQPGIGISEHGFDDIIIETLGIDFSPIWKQFSKQYINGTKDLPLENLFLKAGFKFHHKKTSSLDEIKSILGIRTVAADGWVKITHVLEGGAAQISGIAPGDILASLNHERITPSRLDEILGQIHKRSKVTIFRHDLELNLSLKLIGHATPQFELIKEQDA